MAAVLWEWLHSYVGIYATSEADFSNGYLLAALLAKYNQQPGFPERFHNSQHADAKLNNFALLQPTLRSLGEEHVMEGKNNYIEGNV
jgi:hypothetical protein